MKISFLTDAKSITKKLQNLLSLLGAKGTKKPQNFSSTLGEKGFLKNLFWSFAGIKAIRWSFSSISYLTINYYILYIIYWGPLKKGTLFDFRYRGTHFVTCALTLS